MTRADSAYANMVGHKMNCSQCVLTAFSQEIGLDILLARKVALGFGGGMARNGKTCGAVTGSYMVLGLKQDLSNPEIANQIKEKVYAQINEFNRRFKEVHGSIECKELLGCDLSTEEGSAAANEKHLFTTLCPEFVRSAVEIVEELGR
jgi:C_GCAxxG_C_C family probable redox protein